MEPNRTDLTIDASLPTSDPASSSGAFGVAQVSKNIVTTNPFTGRNIDSYDLSSNLEAIVENSHERFLTWRGTSHQERRDHLSKLASMLRNTLKKLAGQITLEMGKPIREAEAEISKCALLCDYYAENIEVFLSGREISWQNSKGYPKKSEVRYEPLGCILGVMPWNYPFWQVFRFAVPALAAGNVVLLKHARNVTGCALLIENLFKLAGFPNHTFKSLLIDHEATENLIRNRRIKGVSMTGSSGAGKKIAVVAAGEMKPTLFELGGSDPYIVLADADVQLAAETCVRHRILNGGQSCIAAKRFVVDKEVASQFTEAVVEICQNLTVGDPSKEDTDIGPLARLDLRIKLEDQFDSSIASGAKLVWQHKEIDSKGFFFPPAVVLDPPVDSPAYSDELFGPVCTIITAKDESDACHIANDTPFGLGAAIFSKDCEKAKRLAADQIEAGMVTINDGIQSNPTVPFGGIGESGYGRECSSEGFRAFSNQKIITTSGS